MKLLDKTYMYFVGCNLMINFTLPKDNDGGCDAGLILSFGHENGTKVNSA